MQRAGLCVSALAALVAAPAAAILPPPLKSLLDDAIASGHDGEIATVAKYLRRASPGDVDEIDAAIAAHNKRTADARVEKLRNADMFDNWTGKGEVGAFLSSGNANNAGFTLGLTLAKENLHWRHNLRARADYQRSNGLTSREQLLAAYEPNYKFRDGVFAFGLAQYERDRFQGFNARTTVSGGMGYRAIATSALTVDIKAGPAWRQVDYVVGPSTNRLSGLFGANYAWKISPVLAFSEGASTQIDSIDHTFTSMTALDAKVSKSFSTRISVRVDYESSPPVGVKKTDTLTRFSVVYGF